MEFEWDPNKSQTNMKKHGVAFETVTQVFTGFHMTKEDTRQDYGELRFCTMGTMDYDGRVVIVAYTRRNHKIRIISARKANSREQKIFNNYRNMYHKEN